MPPHDALAFWQGEAESALLPLLAAIHAALAAGGEPPERLLSLLALTASLQAQAPAREAFGETLAGLVRVETLPTQAQAVAVGLSLPRGQMVAQRAAEVLAGRSAAFVSPYARLAAQILVWDAAREGAQAGAVQGGARLKTFIRVRPAQERRAHSSLEGLTIPVDDLYNIGGTLAYGPGDERLPWSERAFCGHVLRFER